MSQDRLSSHFSFSELVHTDYNPLQQKNSDSAIQYRPKLQKLAEFAEQIREILDCPMIITSGYRCEELNKYVGGSPTSQHVFCEAFDFIPKNMDAYQAFAKIIVSNIEYQQLILEKRGIGHIIHIGIGSKRQKMFSPKQGVYKNVL